jgi:hypothetical protein
LCRNCVGIAKMKKGLNLLKPFSVLCVPARARTVDPMIKSHLLYQLSYGDKFGSANIVLLYFYRNIY